MSPIAIVLSAILARHRERYSGSLRKLSTIRPKPCSRFPRITVHVDLETLSSDLTTRVPPARRATQHERHRVVRRTTRPISRPLASRSAYGPSVIVFDFGVKMPRHEASKSGPCITDNHPNRALVAALIRSRRTGQKCFSVWKPTLAKLARAASRVPDPISRSLPRGTSTYPSTHREPECGRSIRTVGAKR